MARNKNSTVVSTTARNVNGRMTATDVTFSDGSTKRLLTPCGKGAKYAAELHEGVHYTNTGRVKTNQNGVARRITDTEAAYRSGYLAAQKDSARAYKANNGQRSAGSVRKSGKRD